jgi:hypothetical protein
MLKEIGYLYAGARIFPQASAVRFASTEKANTLY